MKKGFGQFPTGWWLDNPVFLHIPKAASKLFAKSLILPLVTLVINYFSNDANNKLKREAFAQTVERIWSADFNKPSDSRSATLKTSSARTRPSICKSYQNFHTESDKLLVWQDIEWAHPSKKPRIEDCLILHIGVMWHNDLLDESMQTITLEKNHPVSGPSS
jgi:hypothetical protein